MPNIPRHKNLASVALDTSDKPNRRRFLAGAGLAAGTLLTDGELFAPRTAAAGPPVGNWQLVWSDDFTSFNAARWQKREELRGNGNHGVPWGWRRENVWVANSNLVIRTKANGDGTFSAGNAWTKDLFWQTFGYFEARIKLPPAGNGHQAAFWMVAQDGGHFRVGDDGRDGAEIDIAEMPHVADTYVNALHWDGYGADHQNWVARPLAAGIHSGYHVFGVEWTWNALKYYYDNELLSASTYTGVGVPRVGEVLQCSVGILQAAEGDIRVADLPQYTYVDWVKVYRRVSPVVDNTSTDLVYGGTWKQMFDDNDYQGSISQSGTAGSYVQHTFTGTSAAVAVRKGTWGGYVDVLVDGELVRNDYDTYSPTVQHQQVIYQDDTLPARQHTVRLVATGGSNPASQGKLAMFDYFRVS